MYSAKPLPDYRAAGWRRVSEIAELADIFEPAMQVCSWQRSTDANMTTYLAETSRLANRQIRETLKAGDRGQLDGLPTGKGHELLRDDVTLLAEILCELVDCPAVGIRFVCVGKAMCPRWHVDHVPIRLVCTYTGPGTEWLEDQEIDKSRLTDSEVVSSACQRAATGEAVLLKGSLWQGNLELGAIHRSPAIATGEQQRLLLTLDPLWTD